jgi:hypothetical protein
VTAAPPIYTRAQIVGENRSCGSWTAGTRGAHQGAEGRPGPAKLAQETLLSSDADTVAEAGAEADAGAGAVAVAVADAGAGAVAVAVADAGAVAVAEIARAGSGWERGGEFRPATREALTSRAGAPSRDALRDPALRA